MRTFKSNWILVIPLIVLACMLVPASAVADSSPGSGVAGDPDIYEGVVNTGFGTVFAGDVILCEYGATCTTTSTANWEGVLVFFDGATNPFSTDTSFDADSADIFSTNQGGSYSLATFLGNTDDGTLLSANVVILDLSASAPTAYLDGYYEIYTPVAEPGSLILLGSGLLGMAGLLRRRIATS